MADNKARRQRAADLAMATDSDTAPGTAFVATPEAKKKALTYRIIAAVLWVASIAVEVYVIWKILLAHDTGDHMTLLIILLVVMAALTLIGAYFWRKANHIDPASAQEKFRFFVQNQLGAIIAVIAFLPIIVLIFTDKDLSGKQKGLLGGLAILIGAAVVAGSADWDPASQEGYSTDNNIVNQITNPKGVVWYSPTGSTYHVCKDGATITGHVNPDKVVSGTVDEARAAGAKRLTKSWEPEARLHCGVPQATIDNILNGGTGLTSGDLDETVDDPSIVHAPATSGAPVPTSVVPAPVSSAPVPVPAG
ncbi:MAG: hypothetical protein QM774_06325 [Gordonia sp. (in: high G+C Gram-positive bacteria)]|uniref:hypothetical protein n=1 Tax=Gordonia sp. (in: high G+C Gram-positive bacteria) TaxID=84139 RepID=UPI0039E5B926